MTQPYQALPGGESRLGVLIRQLQGRVPTAVTVLPAAPFDGQEIYYAADAANGVIWHLRYNAASASAYKWEFVGGSSLRNTGGPEDRDSAGVWTYFRGTDPAQITVPLNGEYETLHACRMVNLAAAALAGAASNVGTGSTPRGADGFGSFYQQFTYQAPTATSRFTAVAGEQIGMVFALGDTTPPARMRFENKELRLWPVRVA